MTHEQLIAAVAHALGVTLAQLRSRSRKRHIAHARQAACWALRTAYPKLSQQSIGDQLGGLDHTTVRYAIERVALRLAEDTALFMAIYAALPFLFQPPPLACPEPCRRVTNRDVEGSLVPGMAFWVTLGRREWAVVAA